MLPQTFTLHAQLLPFYQICMPSQVWSRACAYLSSEDSICGAAASLVGSEVPTSIESATALDRDGRVARRKRSTLQVVRVTCLAARVGRDAAALALGGRVHSSQGACAAERQADMGLLDLVLLCGRRSVAGGGVGSARHARGSRLTSPWRFGTRLSYPRYLIYLILGTRVSPLQLNVFSKHTARSLCSARRQLPRARRHARPHMHAPAPAGSCAWPSGARSPDHKRHRPVLPWLRRPRRSRARAAHGHTLMLNMRLRHG